MQGANAVGVFDDCSSCLSAHFSSLRTRAPRRPRRCTRRQINKPKRGDDERQACASCLAAVTRKMCYVHFGPGDPAVNQPWAWRPRREHKTRTESASATRRRRRPNCHKGLVPDVARTRAADAHRSLGQSVAGLSCRHRLVHRYVGQQHTTRLDIPSPRDRDWCWMRPCALQVMIKNAHSEEH